jgi:hypothetical protein
MTLEIDADSAVRHLLHLDPDQIEHLWLVTDDRGARPARPLTGTLLGLMDSLQRWQRDGYAVHVCVNAMRGMVRRVSETQRIRAVFAEMDCEPRKAFACAPSFCVRTSPGRFHAYWLTQADDPPTISEAGAMQKVIVETYGADPQAKDVARVLRLAGTWHQKARPVQTAIFGDIGRRYGRGELLAAFPPPTPTPNVIVAMPPVGYHDSYVRAAIQSLAAELASAPVGNRNGTLNRVAYRLGQLGIDAETALQTLKPIALAIGLTSHETEATIRSGFLAGSASAEGGS